MMVNMREYEAAITRADKAEFKVERLTKELAEARQERDTAFDAGVASKADELAHYRKSADAHAVRLSRLISDVDKVRISLAIHSSGHAREASQKLNAALNVAR